MKKTVETDHLPEHVFQELYGEDEHDDTEYDVDGVYTAKELADDINLIIEREDEQADNHANYEESYRLLRRAILEHLEGIRK